MRTCPSWLVGRVWFCDLRNWKTYWSHWKKPQSVNIERAAPLEFSLCWRGFYIYRYIYTYPYSVVSVSQHLSKKKLLTSKPVGCFFSSATQICLFRASPLSFLFLNSPLVFETSWTKRRDEKNRRKEGICPPLFSLLKSWTEHRNRLNMTWLELVW